MKLKPLQVIAILVLLLAAGAFKWQYGRRSKKAREQLEEMERDNDATSAARMKQIEQMKANARSLRTGIPSCDALADLQMDGPPPCKNKPAREAIDKLLAGSLDRMMQSKSAAEMGQVCQQILDEATAQRATCGA